MIKHLCFLLILFSSFQFTYAEIHKFPQNNYHLKTGIFIPGFSIQFIPDESESNKIELEPNIDSQLTVGVHIKDLFGIGWGFSGKASDESIQEKGKTKYNDFRFHFAFDKFMISTNYSQYEGFYIKNGSTNTGNRIYPNFRLTNFNFDFIYNFHSHKFSLPALFDQTQRQEKSAGVFLLAGSINHTSLKSNSVFLNSSFNSDQNLTNLGFYSLNTYAGGGYTLVMKKKFYISGVGLLGVGVQNGQLKQISGAKKEKWDFTQKLTLNLGFGYNGNRFFSSLGVFVTGIKYKLEESSFDNNMASISLNFGWHL